MCRTLGRTCRNGKKTPKSAYARRQNVCIRFLLLLLVSLFNYRITFIRFFRHIINILLGKLKSCCFFWVHNIYLSWIVCYWVAFIAKNKDRRHNVQSIIKCVCLCFIRRRRVQTESVIRKIFVSTDDWHPIETVREFLSFFIQNRKMSREWNLFQSRTKMCVSSWKYL